MKPCCLFSYVTAAVAAKHMQFDTIDIIKDIDTSGNFAKYPDDYLYGMGFVTYQALVQCKNCDVLFCKYMHEKILSMDDGICFFTSYYPVGSRNEALSFSLDVNQSVWIEKMAWIGGVQLSWKNPNKRKNN